ncbi:unnamed protein product [Periconia digitata]|uniref:Uncharacterized protein n=1 Tax=Periconia digitata TaxID=1303443 RepID=A0A9W4URP6_9PLEO|nr:unnamed protein product [Periconia digitata]
MDGLEKHVLPNPAHQYNQQECISSTTPTVVPISILSRNLSLIHVSKLEHHHERNPLVLKRRRNRQFPTNKQKKKRHFMHRLHMSNAVNDSEIDLAGVVDPCQWFPQIQSNPI